MRKNSPPLPPSKSQRLVVEACRVLVGLVFVFSGFVKAVDPLGFAYKIQDYLEAGDLFVFDAATLPAAFFLSALEFTLGVCLLTGVFRRVTSRLVLAFMCVMTPLTLYLAIFNPVSDCGCFGDALALSNWQTFFKNVALIVAAFLLFLRNNQLFRFYSRRHYGRIVAFTVVFILGVSIYSFRYLPILDFRPYQVGVNIPASMLVPENAPANEYETILVYENGGKRENFTIDDYPGEDSGWTFVTSVNRLVRKGYEPVIHDFSITTEIGDDITAETLANAGYTFFLIAYKLTEADESNTSRINAVYDYALQNGYRFFCLTSSLPNDIDEWRENTGAEYPFCTTDDTALKTIIRSNPGLMLIKDGTIVRKWPNRRIPDESLLQKPLEDSPLGTPPANHDVRNVLLLAGILILPLFALGIVRKKSNHNHNHNLKKK